MKTYIILISIAAIFGGCVYLPHYPSAPSGRGTGSFREIYPGSLYDICYGSSVLKDIDGDGNLDLIMTGSTGSNRVSVIYRGNGNGSFTEINPGLLMGLSMSDLALGDINKDGKPDLILTGNIDFQAVPVPVTKIYLGNGDGSFTEINPGLPITGVYDGCVTLGDINSDSKIDLILSGATSNDGNMTYVYTNDGQGGFTETGHGFFTGISSHDLVVGDINANGKLDLIFSGEYSILSSNTSKIFSGNGDGSFIEINPGMLTNMSGGSVILADLDNNATLDLVLSGIHIADYITVIYLGNGDGSFTETNSGLLQGFYQGCMVCGDINGDNKPDLIISGRTNNADIASKIYKGNGDGSFTEISPGPLASIWATSMTLGDIDGDNDLDLIFMGWDTNGFPITKIFQNY